MHVSTHAADDRQGMPRPHPGDHKVLYMSGYTDNAIVHNGLLDEDIAFLPSNSSFRKPNSKFA